MIKHAKLPWQVLKTIIAYINNIKLLKPRHHENGTLYEIKIGKAHNHFWLKLASGLNIWGQKILFSFFAGKKLLFI